MQTANIFVERTYRMDPEFDDLVAEGRDLREGMIVLFEDSSLRVNIEDDMEPFRLERALEMNRWCTVTRIQIMNRYERDTFGGVIAESSPLVSFVAVYADGTKKKRSFDNNYAWLVKKDSIPTEEN